ncbi:DUF1543 domain-containing protein [Spirosoma sp. HMF4905]|uniref:DUF1543 domain-containing protein n=1 Tax=Spirosoma arboris TaxID=2682092 RepID=A0A7K1S5U1_9BACT|nr:DUF1543 domain-containing protein [Spirosoma arboris]MVM29105.1 DUF1543 domain-containing protein [Spirosoma arboris]
MPGVTLFMVLLGCKPQGRHVEQHDVFFGIGSSLNDLVPDMKAFWPEAAGKLHIDAWRKVTAVEGYQVRITPRTIAPTDETSQQQTSKLFFINLGGYQPNKFEEQHYVLLTVKSDRAAAFKEAKQTLFFKHNHFEKAVSHIDDKYGIDVDDLYQIEEILSLSQKDTYQIELLPASDLPEDPISLGYLKLSSLTKA